MLLNRVLPLPGKTTVYASFTASPGRCVAHTCALPASGLPVVPKVGQRVASCCSFSRSDPAQHFPDKELYETSGTVLHTSEKGVHNFTEILHARYSWMAKCNSLEDMYLVKMLFNLKPNAQRQI